jgi:hypothetical protein
MGIQVTISRTLYADQLPSDTERTFREPKITKNYEDHLRHIKTGTLKHTPHTILKTKIIFLTNLFKLLDFNF